MSNEVQKVRVTQAVEDGLQAVRESGLTNMFDRHTVARLAREMGYDDAADWAGTDTVVRRGEYGRWVFGHREVFVEDPD